jgi:hypothetical protein
VSSTTPAPLAPEARQAVIDAEVAKAVRDGWTVQSVSSAQAVLTKARRLSFWRNLIGLVLTGGLWVIYIIWRLANRRKAKTLVVSVDAYGRVTRS